jgi:streptomycin 6-kinase
MPYPIVPNSKPWPEDLIGHTGTNYPSLASQEEVYNFFQSNSSPITLVGKRFQGWAPKIKNEKVQVVLHSGCHCMKTLRFQKGSWMAIDPTKLVCLVSYFVLIKSL